VVVGANESPYHRRMTSSRAFVKPSVPNASVRLQKALADAGIAARRDCELLILKGRVHVNGREVRALPCFVDPKNDVVTFDGVPVDISTEPLWGVGSTPPYGHDGRSINLREVILRHGGEAKASRDLFAAMPDIRMLRAIRSAGTAAFACRYCSTIQRIWSSRCDARCVRCDVDVTPCTSRGTLAQ